MAKLSKLTFARFEPLTSEDFEGIGKLMTDEDRSRHAASKQEYVGLEQVLKELPIKKAIGTMYGDSAAGQLATMGAPCMLIRGKPNRYVVLRAALTDVVKYARIYLDELEAKKSEAAKATQDEQLTIPWPKPEALQEQKPAEAPSVSQIETKGQTVGLPPLYATLPASEIATINAAIKESPQAVTASALLTNARLDAIEAKVDTACELLDTIAQMMNTTGYKANKYNFVTSAPECPAANAAVPATV